MKLRCFAKENPTFANIWQGGLFPPGTPLIIKHQVAVDDGHLIYNGKPYNKRAWSWRPPKVIREQGRMAKEFPDPRNNHPVAIVEEVDKYGQAQLKFLTECICGGAFVFDECMWLCCEVCGLTYDY